MNNNINFFTFGLPKSGTTFLQRTLNLHPQIASPSEHQLDFILKQYEKLFSQYNKALQIVDHRTGGQGSTPISNQGLLNIYKCTILSIMEDFAKGKKFRAINDNAIIHKLDFYNTLFDKPKMIAIVRNPLNQSISAWHHNERLAIEENNPQHRELNNKFGGFDGWVLYNVKIFSQTVKNLQAFQKKFDNLHIVCYESLVKDKEKILMEIFSFLGVEYDNKLLEQIVQKSSFESMKKESNVKGFFRNQQLKVDKNSISDKLIQEVFKISANEMKVFNYGI